MPAGRPDNSGRAPKQAGFVGDLLGDRVARIDLGVLAGLSVLAFGVQSLAWPLFPGRDAQTYLMYYLEMWHRDAVFPQLMLLRTPAAPLFNGLLLDVGGSWLLEAALGCLYVVTILAMYCLGSFWSRRIGLASAVALLAYPGYGALFHSVSSDALFAFGLVAWAVFIVATAARPTPRKFVLHGAVLFVLVLTRPSGLFFVPLFALFPFLLPGSLRQRLTSVGLYAATTVILLASFAVYDQARYGEFNFTRYSPAHYPLYRVLVIDRLVEPDNGPASRELAQAIESDLLQEEPYRSYGVTLNEFLTTGRARPISDLAGLSDRVWGWDDDYSKLRAVSLEAIRAHPWGYAKGTARTTKDLLTAKYFPPVPSSPPPPRTILCELGCFGDGFVTVNGRKLPEPIEPGEPIPTGHAYWLASTPDNRITTDWSVISRPRLRFDRPGDAAHFERLSSDLAALMSQLPSRDGVSFVGARLRSVSDLYPAMWIWLLVGAIGLALRPQRHVALLVFLCSLGLALVGFTALGEPAAPEYRMPADPLFVLFGIAGLVGSEVAGQPIRARRLWGWLRGVWPRRFAGDWNRQMVALGGPR